MFALLDKICAVGDFYTKSLRCSFKHGLEKELKDELFNRIHVKEQIPKSHEFFTDIFASLGIPSEKFEQDYNSFVTQAKIAEYDRYTKDFKIEAVLEIIVKGKYLALTDNLESVEDYQK